MLMERMNYLTNLRIENCITKSLSYEEAIQDHAAKKCRKKLLQRRVRQLINKHIVLFLWILCCLRHLSAFLNLLLSHSK